MPRMLALLVTFPRVIARCREADGAEGRAQCKHLSRSIDSAQKSSLFLAVGHAATGECNFADLQEYDDES